MDVCLCFWRVLAGGLICARTTTPNRLCARRSPKRASTHTHAPLLPRSPSRRRLPPRRSAIYTEWCCCRWGCHTPWLASAPAGACIPWLPWRGCLSAGNPVGLPRSCPHTFSVISPDHPNLGPGGRDRSPAASVGSDAAPSHPVRRRRMPVDPPVAEALPVSTIPTRNSAWRCYPVGGEVCVYRHVCRQGDLDGNGAVWLYIDPGTVDHDGTDKVWT